MTLLALAFVACVHSGAECTLEARSSLTLSVVGEAGEPVPDAALTWSVDGGAPQPCEAIGGDWVCGWEVEGDITVRADAPGYGAVERTWTIEADACHVEGVVDTIVLPSVDCTQEEVASVRVTVWGGDVPFDPTSVTWTLDGTAQAEQPCDRHGVGDYACGYEVAGDLVVTARDGDEVASEVVTVGQDDCHVVTETVDLVLYPEQGG